MLGLIDGDVLLHSALWESKDLNHFKNKLSLTIDEWVNRSFCDDFVIALGNGDNYRDDLYPEYKRSLTREKGRKARVEFFEEAKQEIINLDQTSVADYIEADDLIGWWSSEVADYVIISSDKDLDQLPGKHYNTRRNSYYEVNKEQCKNFFKLQMIIGDPIDNIPGIRGYGPKKFESLKDKDLIDIYKEKFEEEYENYFLLNGKLLWIQKRPFDHFTMERYLSFIE